MYTFKKQLVSKENYPIKCPYPMKVEYITVHDTGNRASAVNEIQYMISNNHEVSFHLAVDETEAIQGLPFDRNSWSCGDGAKGTGNRQSLSVEICRPTHEDKSIYMRAEENAVYVVARLLHMNGLSIDRLRKHQLSKINSWVYMDDVEKMEAHNSFLVEIVCDDLNVRQQADFQSKVVGTVKRGEVYTIVKEENGLGKLKSGIGYISMNQQYVRRKLG